MDNCFQLEMTKSVCIEPKVSMLYIYMIFVLSVCDVNGREHNIQQALIMCRRKSRFSEVE